MGNAQQLRRSFGIEICTGFLDECGVEKKNNLTPSKFPVFFLPVGER